MKHIPLVAQEVLPTGVINNLLVDYENMCIKGNKTFTKIKPLLIIITSSFYLFMQNIKLSIKKLIIYKSEMFISKMYIFISYANVNF